MNKIDQRWVWVFLGIFTILVRVILGNFPQIIEQYYSRGIYIGIRTIIDYTIALSPIPLIYLLIFGILCFILFRIFRKKNKQQRIKQRLTNFIFSLVAFLFGIVFLFLTLWGFNYARVPIENQIGIEPNPLSKEELFQELEISTTELINAFAKVKDYDYKVYEEFVFKNSIEDKIRIETIKTFKELGYPTPGRIRARYLYPKGTLLRISTAGFYLPLTGECHVDPGLHPLQIPFVLAHEFSHGYGIGDEGSCNFIGYLTCKNSSNPVIRYSGLLSYWRSVASQYRRFDPDHYKEFRSTIPQGIIDHLREINAQMDKYPDLFPAVRDATYHAYLQTQGIEEGLKNYSRVILLVNAYRKKVELEEG
jgi:uncharacterized protein DUF3810